MEERSVVVIVLSKRSTIWRNEHENIDKRGTAEIH